MTCSSEGISDISELAEYFFLVKILQDEGAELPFTPPMRGELFVVRSGVRPKLQRSAVEVRILKQHP